MKHNQKKRSSKVLSIALAVAMILTSTSIVFAADSVLPDDYRGLKSAQPDLKGYRTQEIATWSPETDPYAEYLKADVPLQERNEPFKATQANPDLDSDAQIMLMQGDYGNAFFESPLYNNDFSNLCFNFWQYTDYFVPWHGAVAYDTPESFYDNPKTSWWTSRGFEFGIINIPTAAYTNAAHKNGALSLACIYFDPTGRPGQTCSDMVKKDAEGGFPVAEKMIEMAKYYGFDGYFFNQEEMQDQTFKAFMKKIRDAGLYVQYYNTVSSFQGKASWLGDGNEVYADSVFVNYAWPGNLLAGDKEYFENHPEVDPYEVAFYGVEANQSTFSGKHPSASQVPTLYKDGTKNPIASIVLFTPSDFYHRGLTDNLNWTGAWDGESPNQNPAYQWMIAERERMYFSGVKCDPTNTGRQYGYSRIDVGVADAGGWVGVADFASERSVIGGSTFYTNFNTGHGMQQFKEGKVSNDEEWTNLNVQDILPTWQWWIDSTGDKLSADFDYGEKEARKGTKFQDISTPYTQVGAYDGGSSLVLYGDLTAKNTMHLYKTDLAVNANSSAELTFRKTSAGSAKMQLGLIFKDAPDQVEAIDVPDSETAGGWVTRTLDLSAYADREIAAICLIFDGNETGYQMNIGGLRILDGNDYTPAAPTGFAITNAYADEQMELVWDLADYDEVKQYNVYGNFSDGSRRYLGGIYGDNFYIKNLYGETEAVTLELRAVGADGSESEAAKVTYTFNDKVSNITVPQATTDNGRVTGNAKANVVEAQWTAPATGDFDHYKVTVELKFYGKTYEGDHVYTVTAPKDATSVEVPVPVGERYDYNLSVQTVSADGTEGEPIYFAGKLHDSYAAPMPFEDMKLGSSYGGLSLTFETPELMDWYIIHITVNDGAEQTRQRATSSARYGVNVKEGDTISVVMEDYAGNKSTPTKAIVQDGQLVEAGDPVVERVTVSPSEVTVQKGQTQAFTATVVGTGPISKDVTWEVSGNTSDATVISASGLLTVGKDETAESLTVKAVSVTDNEKTAEAKVTVIDRVIEGLSVAVTPAEVTLDQGGEQQFTATVTLPEQPDTTPVSVMDNAAVVTSENVASASNFIDGVLGNGTNAVDRNKSASVTFDIGEEKRITEWSLYTQLNALGVPFGAKTIVLSYAESKDGPYTEIDRIVDPKPEGELATPLPTTQTLAQAVTARYFKVEILDWYLQANGDPDWPGMEDVILYTAEEAEEISEDVIWTVEGAQSLNTSITQDGLLKVGADEKSAELTVRATSAADKTKSGTALVNVNVKDPVDPNPPVQPSKPYEPATEYYVAVNVGEHGTVTPGSGMYAIGSKQSFTIKPDAGYEIDKVLVDGKEVGVSGGVLTLYIDEPYRVSVTFKEAESQPSIDVSKPSTGGTTATPNPQTGDSLPIAGLAATLILAGGTLFVLRRSKNK